MNKLTLKLLKNYVPENDLEKEVKKIIINNTENYALKSFFEDLFEHGCSSGMVSEMIYYKDTHAFTKRHLEDIMELVENLEEEMGEPLEIKDDRLNFYAWLAFEEIARKIYHDLGGENY